MILRLVSSIVVVSRLAVWLYSMGAAIPMHDLHANTWHPLLSHAPLFCLHAAYPSQSKRLVKCVVRVCVSDTNNFSKTNNKRSLQLNLDINPTSPAPLHRQPCTAAPS